MARQVLENGVILPAEYSDDWYDDMTSNLTKLDDVIGSDSEKLSSADVGAAALSNSYNDLDNLPTIPTKTSDLTNDSNFVDTSNSAVASGITSAKVTSYDSHIADTDIHVTTADKTKWNNGVSQAYVFRYSSTALVASSTNSNTLLDNTDNLKVGDKVIDSSGVLFSITAIDSVNSTFTIGSALVDLALDGNVVHTSGNETVGGVKTFSNNTYITSLNFTSEVASPSSSSSSIMPIIATITYGDSSPSVQARLNLRITADGIKSLYPHENNQYALGLTSRKWSEVHGVTYYYGSSDVEFSNKFVTTDTDQTISGDKTFSSIIPIDGVYLGNESSTNERTNLCLRSNRDTANKSCAYISRFRTNKNQGELSDSDISFISISFLENETRYTRCFDFGLTDWDTDGVPQTYYLTSPGSKGSLGTRSRKWTTFNGINPGALSFPDLNNGIDISGYFDLSLYTGQTYTPSVDGWISLSVTSPNRGSILAETFSISQTAYGVADPDNTSSYRVCILIPCFKNVAVTFYIRASGGSFNSAKFIPCQGNV